MKTIGTSEILYILVLLVLILAMILLIKKVLSRKKPTAAQTNKPPVTIKQFSQPVSGDQVFVSYSRKDSAFATSLAKDLAANGVNVWIDQVNIPGGVAWEKAIEKALVSAPSVLVILSKASVDSENVLDEIAYAIQHNKKIIPVLAEQCQVPMRLGRLHNIDFTQGRAKGLSKLLEAINS
jgi:hypothetical protein